MHIFNPENDLALANFSPHYTAPASALKMRSDLALLPLWYAKNDSLVVADDAYNHKFLAELKNKLPIESSIITSSQIVNHTNKAIKPWGWNPSLKYNLEQLGVDEKCLPSVEHLRLIREYSNRECAVKLLRDLKPYSTAFCGTSYCLRDLTELIAYLDKSKAPQVLKMPYSGSGKGIVWLKNGITDKQLDWCKRVIRTQGSIIIEPVLDKVQDFAMEFEITNNGIQFTGYSLFNSSSSGAYTGNILLPDQTIENILSNYIEQSLLLGLVKLLRTKLPNYFPSYRGVLGVDMMICKTAKSVYQLQPCVEVNMRMNMGVVAHRIYDKFISKESTGCFTVSYFKNRGEALHKSTLQQQENPLLIKNGRIISGYLALTPINERTNYIAAIDIKEK